MNHLRAALILSVGIHFVLFWDARSILPNFFSKPSSRLSQDYHLPIAIELTGGNEKIPESSRNQLPPPSQANAHNLVEKKIKPYPSERIKIKNAASVVSKEQGVKPLSSQQEVQPSRIEVSRPSEKAWNRSPIYPDEARRLKQQGRVLIEAQLNATGKVVSVKVVKSSGYESLDAAALQAVCQWTMDAPEKTNRRIFIPITFTLN